MDDTISVQLPAEGYMASPPSPLKSSVIAPSQSPGYSRVDTSGTASSVNYEAEEEPYNPRWMVCCDRCSLEMRCRNAGFSVWTTLGRLEWADAFGRGGSGCGCHCMRIRPLGPGPMRLVRPLLFLGTLAINVYSAVVNWEGGVWFMQFTHWINPIGSLYLLLASVLCFWLHGQDYVPVAITPLGKIVWFTHTLSFATTAAISSGYWLTNALFTNLDPAFTDYFDHGVLAIIMMIDFYIGAQPMFLIHVIYPIILMILWLFWSIIQYVLKLPPVNPGGGIYIYSFIDWADPLPTFGIAVAILAWIIFVYIIIWSLARGRDVPFKHYDKTLHI